jgi:glutathione S-transferase
MYVLHYAPDNASLILRIALLEAGVAFTPRLVDRRLRAQDSPGYRRLAPTGLIPTLETPEGALFETGAVLVWLCDRHPAARLGPGPDSPLRGHFLKWLFFLSNSAHADLRRLFYPLQYVPPEAVAGHHDLICARMTRHFALLDRACAQDPDLFAPPTALAIYVCTLMRWSVLYPAGQTPWLRYSDYPALRDLCEKIEQRPAVRAAARAEGLGPMPFTAPHPPCPPEGSAT